MVIDMLGKATLATIKSCVESDGHWETEVLFETGYRFTGRGRSVGDSLCAMLNHLLQEVKCGAPDRERPAG